MPSRFTSVVDNLLGSLLWHALWYAIIPFLAGLGVIVWETVRNSWGPWTLALGVFVAASVMVFINGILTSKRFLERSPSAWGSERLERQLRDWTFNGASLGVAPTRGQIRPDAEFAFDVVTEDQRYILVLGTKHYIEFLARLQLTYDGKTLEQVVGEQAHYVHHSLRIELARFGVGFKPSSDLDELMLQSVIPRDDSLNQFVFMQELFILRRAIALAIETLTREIHYYSAVANS